ncbi:unnamed protein product [Cunninghamella blakesleeana]
MYEKQVAYLKKDKIWKVRQYHSITKAGDELYIIGGKTFISFNTKTLHQKHYHQYQNNNNNNNNNMQIITLPIKGHTLHKINNTLFISLFGKTTNTTTITTERNDILLIHKEESSSIFTTSFLKPTTISPLKRYGHTSVLLNNTIYVIGGASTVNPNTLFTEVWKLDWSTNIWIKLLDNINPIIGHSTILLSDNSNNNNSSNSTTTTLLTCFGSNQSFHHLHNKNSPIQFYNYCTLFNIYSLQYKSINNIPLQPRIYSTMVSVNNTHAIIYGGLSEKNHLLNDMWWVQLNNHMDDISFHFIDTFIPRAKHAALMISDDHLLINGGQYIGSAMDETKIYNINDFNSHIKKNHQHQHHHKLHSRAEPFASNNNNNGLTGGAIVGMVVGILLAVAMAIILFIFIQRKHRQHRTYDIHSRAARFSLSTPPRQSASILERKSQNIQSPELARTRLSQMSFGSDFRLSINDQPKRQSNLIISSSPSSTSLPSITPPSSQNHNTTLESPSRQLYTNWVCETPEPPASITRNSTFVNNINNNHLLSSSKDHQPHPLSMCNNNNSTPSIILEENNNNNHNNKNIQNDNNDPNSKNIQNDNNNNNNHHGKKRFTLNLFKNNLDDTSFQLQSSSATEASSYQLGDTQTTKRRSSLFGLSKFLNLTETTNQEMEVNNNMKEDELYNKDLNQLSIQKEMRASLGSKSVSSIQWVGFNNDMDFSTNRSSPRLAVMNPRHSYTTISNSSGILSGIASMNSSDDLPHHNQSPRNSSVYRLSQRELKSWDDNRLSLLITPPPPLHRQ